MHALVTTSRSVLLLDTGTGTWRPVHRGKGRYYGICRHRDAFWIAARRRGMNDAGGPGDDRGCLVRISPRNAPELREYDIPLRDLHGIASVDGAIWCTCTYDNAIAVLENGKPSLHYPLGCPTQRPFDRNHLNSLLVVPEGVLLLAHNMGESEVVLLDAETMAVKRRLRLGVRAHNLWFDGPALRVCSSGEGLLVGDDGFRLHVGGFPRGYATDGNNRLVGIVAIAARQSRDQQTNYIKLLDQQYRQISEFSLEDEGMVMDIALLSEHETPWVMRLADAFARLSERDSSPVFARGLASSEPCNFG